MRYFSEYFEKKPSTLAQYLSGESSPTLAQTWKFVLKYAENNGGKRIDINWLIDDMDTRPGPVFTGEDMSARLKKEG